MSRRNKLFLSSGIVVLLVGAVMMSIAARRDRAVQVRLDPVTRRHLVATVTASGQIVPKTAVDISADITGRIVADQFSRALGQQFVVENVAGGGGTTGTGSGVDATSFPFSTVGLSPVTGGNRSGQVAIGANAI